MIPRHKLIRPVPISERRTLSRARREHDRAMREPGIAREHQIQIGRALDRGEHGCTFCTDRIVSHLPMTIDTPRSGPGRIPPVGRLIDERYMEIGELRLRISVEGEGPPLLLINGLGANIELWQRAAGHASRAANDRLRRARRRRISTGTGAAATRGVGRARW